MLFTFLRKGLLILLPVLLVLIIQIFKVRTSIYILLSFLFVFLSIVINAVFFDFHVVNTIMSLLLLFLPTVLLVSKPVVHYFSIEEWMKYSSHILVLVNLTALVNFLYVWMTGYGLLDDGFNGLYGRSGLSMHTFSLVNFIYCIYYFNRSNITKGILFFCCGFLCFYSLGLMFFLASIFLVLIGDLNKKHLKYLLGIGIATVAIVYSIDRSNPHTFSYVKENIQRSIDVYYNKKPYKSEMEDVRNFKSVKTPRKMLAFEGALNVISDPVKLLFGISPGTYNSRTSFLLNGEYSSSKLFANAQVRPKYAERDIYPLWNKKITFQYNDGTRNEPFSSFIAVIVEYGILQGLILIIMFRKRYKTLKDKNPKIKFFLRFLYYFTLFNMVSENYLEYPEFMLLLIFIFYSLDYSATKKIHA